MSKIIENPQGVGISYRAELGSFIAEHFQNIDVLEIIPEHFIQGDQIVRVHRLNWTSAH